MNKMKEYNQGNREDKQQKGKSGVERRNRNAAEVICFVDDNFFLYRVFQINGESTIPYIYIFCFFLQYVHNNHIRERKLTFIRELKFLFIQMLNHFFLYRF